MNKRLILTMGILLLLTVAAGYGASKFEIFNDGTFKLECPPGAPAFQFLDFVWYSDVRYSIYGFCVKKIVGPLVYAHEPEENTIGYKNMVYKFALPFQDLECTLQGNPELVNTKCMEFSCDDYYSCGYATPLCYCYPGTGNSCQGQCLPFCSGYTGLGVPLQLGQPDANGIYRYQAPGATPIWYRHIGSGNWKWTPYDPYSTLNCWMPDSETAVSNSCRGKWDGQKPVQANIDIINYLNKNKPIPSTASLVTDPDPDTTCADFSCGSYLSCNTIDTCSCSVSANACKGSDCQTLHCDRDSEFESRNKISTQCKDNCAKYGDCSTTTSCACDPGLNACQGSCFCNPQGWKDTGGCDGIREDGVDCHWSEIPQKQEYNPTTCNGPDYRCNAQPLGVCPCVPDMPCADLGCGVSDSCGTYCGNCLPSDSCQGRCGNYDPDASCQCDAACSDPANNDCCGDISQWCS